MSSKTTSLNSHLIHDFVMHLFVLIYMALFIKFALGYQKNMKEKDNSEEVFYFVDAMIVEKEF